MPTFSNILGVPPFARILFAKLKAEARFLFLNARFMAEIRASCRWVGSSLGMVKYAESSRTRLSFAGSSHSERPSSSIDMAIMYSVAVEIILFAYITMSTGAWDSRCDHLPLQTPV